MEVAKVSAARLALPVLLCSLVSVVRASESVTPTTDSVEVPSVALLEFLGNTAGLESLGVNIDQLLASVDMSEDTRKRDSKSED